MKSVISIVLLFSTLSFAANPVVTCSFTTQDESARYKKIEKTFPYSTRSYENIFEYSDFTVWILFESPDYMVVRIYGTEVYKNHGAPIFYGRFTGRQILNSGNEAQGGFTGFISAKNFFTKHYVNMVCFTKSE